MGMITITLDDRRLQLDFMVTPVHTPRSGLQWRTTCMLWQTPLDSLVPVRGVGVGRCQTHSPDLYDYGVGRVKAFDKALKWAIPTGSTYLRGIRKECWRQFNEQSPALPARPKRTSLKPSMRELHERFLKDILKVCKQHKLVISHEDTEGAFRVEPYSKEGVKWLVEDTLYWEHLSCGGEQLEQEQQEV